MTAPRKSLREQPPGLLLHSRMAAIVGTIVVVVSMVAIGGVFATIGLRLPNMRWAFNPLGLLPAALLGTFSNRSPRHRSAAQVWIVGAGSVLVVMRHEVSPYRRSDYYRRLAQGHYWHSEFQPLFSPDGRTCADSECLAKVFVTTPFLCSIAYSIGAWLGLRSVNDATASFPPNGIVQR